MFCRDSELEKTDTGAAARSVMRHPRNEAEQRIRREREERVRDVGHGRHQMTDGRSRSEIRFDSQVTFGV